jgi:predicted transcriptional regulator
MAAPSLDNEFMQLWSTLTVVQKQSLLSVIKSFAQPEEHISLEQYNQEIEEAEAEFENGDYITHEEMLRQLKQW